MLSILQSRHTTLPLHACHTHNSSLIPLVHTCLLLSRDHQIWWTVWFISAVRHAVHVQYIRGHIPMYNLLPVYIPCFLQALTLAHFISTIPNKVQQKQTSLLLSSSINSNTSMSSVAAMHFTSSEQIHSRKKWYDLFCLDRFP